MAPFSAASTGTGECQPSVCRPRPFASSYEDVWRRRVLIRPAIQGTACAPGSPPAPCRSECRREKSVVRPATPATLARYVRDCELFVDNTADALP